jgi:predicted heme/steroid binding protein
VSAWCLWPSQVSGSASNLLLLVFSAYSGLQAKIYLIYQQLIYDMFSNYRYYSGNSKGLIIV